ncbi:MAG TPA: translocation/assembly module TamB domain-containing protein [Thermoanaerobaculia bacterium]|jgi:outer membrane protein insertion porin family|nr:translocation/assembly module TamB domain-containing protein [Thermoanaerobaculia bacterium]
MSEPAMPPSRSRRRRILLILAALFGVALILALAALSALRSASVRQSILGELAGYLRREYGLAMEAEDFGVRWGGFSMDGLKVGAPGGAPLLTARHVDVAVDMRTLRAPVRVIRSLEIDDPSIDLAAPIPKIPESPGPLGFEIRRIVIRRGKIAGAPPEAPVSKYLKSWRVDEIEGGGSLVDELWDLKIESSRVHVERPGFEPLTLQAAAQVEYRDGQPVRIPSLRVAGPGLRLNGSGTVGLEGTPLIADFDAQAEPRLLVAGAPSGGSIRARGGVRLPEGTGKVAVLAREVPAEVLRPYLDTALFQDLSLAGTVADAQADLTLGPETLARVAGQGEAVWRRQDRQLVWMNLGVTPGEGEAIRLTAEGDLLPGSPGKRHLRGTVEAAGWTGLATATAERIDAEVRLPDVKAALAEIRKLWPRLVPAIPATVPVQGSLQADLRASGSLASPLAKVDATWLPEPGSRVHLKADGRLATWTGSAKAELENVPLALAGQQGFVSGTVDLSGSPRSYRTRADANILHAAYPPYLDSLDQAHVTANGSLRLHPLTYAGIVNADGSGLFARPNASDTARLDTFQLASDGTFRLEPLSYQGRISLDGTGLDAPTMVRAERFHLDGDGTFRQSLTPLSATARLDASGVELSGVTLTDLHAEATGEGKEVRISSLSGSLPEGRTFAASGRLTVEPLLQEADLDLKLVKPVDPVREAEMTATLRNGTVEVSAPRIDTDAGPASVQATIPLGALARIPALAETLAALPIEPAPGEVSVDLQAPSVDSQTLLAALGMEPRPERVRAGVSASLTFDPAAPAAGRGEVRIDGLTLESKDGRVTAQEPVIASLGGGRVELRPVRLRVESGEIGATSIDASGSADLKTDWKPFEDPPASLVRTVSGQAGGTLDAALLNPFLEGGEASGSLSFTASANGPLDGLQASFNADGTGARFEFPAAAVEIENPVVSGRLAGGSWNAGGSASLNGGELAFGARPRGEGALVSLSLESVPYRLDYGLTTRVSGLFSLQVPLPFEEHSRMALDGTLAVDRGVLVRDMNLDREVFTLLTAPEKEPGTEETLASRIDLDLNVTTRDGIRVRNNVADLHAHWGVLAVAGTAEEPEIRGRVDLDPGGLLYIYGQTARIDRGSLIFTGNPLEDPLIDFSTTSSLQDPSIAQLRGTTAPLDILNQVERDPLAKEGPSAEEILTKGLASYYSARLFSRFGESVGLTRLSVRPVLVYEEADPTARLTVGGELSRHASFAFSVDLRNAERRTWLLDLHDFNGLSGLKLEAFTTDFGGQGGSLQQALDFGGSRESQEETVGRLRRLRISAPDINGIARWRLRRSIPLRRKEAVPEDAAFDIEVDLAEFLRRRGYPDARVTAETVPVEDRPGWVDVNVAVVELGPRVKFKFKGDRPPRAFRPEILATYRADFYEARSVEEMKEATVRAFRSAGYVQPQVEVEVQKGSPRRVVIRSEAGSKAGLEELEIAGVDPEASRLLASRFPGRLSRAELAAGLPGADRRLLDALGALGYPGARIAGRQVSRNGLLVQVEAGERRTFGRIEISGIEPKDLMPLVPVHPGEPVRWDLVLQGALRIQDALRSKGFPDAEVRVAPPSQTGPVDVRYEVEPGDRVVLAEVGFEGERWTSERQLARAAGLKTGEPLNANEVAEARTRLFETGAFSRVTADVDRSEPGQARVTFSVAESPRFHLGYGVRQESGKGTAAVVDAVDSNFLGRGLTLGLRALYEPDDRSGRLFLRTGLFGTRISLETYGLVRQQTFEDDILGDLQQDIEESSLQLSRPFGRRTTGSLYFRYRTTHLFELEPDPFSPFPFDIELKRPYMGTQVLWDGRNDKVDPTSGQFRSLDLSGSGSYIGSDFDYARLYGQWNLFETFFFAGRPFTWAQGVRTGAAQAFRGQALIEDDRFYAGGEFSVRGYETESLRSTGRPEEEALLVLNQELRFPLPFEGLTGLVFFDAGQIWDRWGDFGTGLAKSLGLGLRVKTPIGLLRFDAAYPLDRRPEDESYKLYFGFGNAF